VRFIWFWSVYFKTAPERWVEKHQNKYIITYWITAKLQTIVPVKSVWPRHMNYLDRWCVDNRLSIKKFISWASTSDYVNSYRLLRCTVQRGFDVVWCAWRFVLHQSWRTPRESNGCRHGRSCAAQQTIAIPTTYPLGTEKMKWTVKKK
jgi:hypothetical protein